MASNTPRGIEDIPGWFTWADQQFFRHFLAEQEEPGALVELGTYLGKSAVLVGEYLRPGERFVVVDLFNDVDTDEANLVEVGSSYRALTKDAFESNYRALRGDLPEVVTGLSSTIVDHLEPGSVRFMHVDASHLYEHVVQDVESATTLMAPDGIVVFDDIRSPHTPGVSAAVWAAVVDGRLDAVMVSPNKLYATVGDGTKARERLRTWLAGADGLDGETQVVAGRDLIRTWTVKSAAAAPAAPTELQKLQKRVRQLNRRVQALENDRSGSAAGGRSIVTRVRSRLGRRG